MDQSTSVDEFASPQPERYKNTFRENEIKIKCIFTLSTQIKGVWLLVVSASFKFTIAQIHNYMNSLKVPPHVGAKCKAENEQPMTE